MPTARSRGLATLALLAAPSCPLFGQSNVTAWHSHGQTWVVWQDTPPTPATYRIYASATDFLTTGDVSSGVEVGRLMEADWVGARLRLALPGASWRAPLPGGGSYALAADEGLFAYTPHAAESLYFAVVKDGEVTVTADNATGPIAQTLAPVTAHLQGTRLTPGSSQPLHVFANWIDGRSDHTSGRPGYPVMGNPGSNGVGTVFLVTEPPGGLAGAEDLPVIVALHGGGGQYMGFVPGGNPDIGLGLLDAIVITPDGTTNTIEGPRGSAWLGYWEDFDRFLTPPLPPAPNDVLVVDYLMRRVLWQIDWVTENFPVAPNRVSLLGHSGGARGAGQLARAYPERFAALHQYCAAMRTGEDDNPFFGSRLQNLPTTVPGAPGVADLADEAFLPSRSERDLPFSRTVIGRADNTSSAGWGLDKVEKFQELDQFAFGRHLFFDERGHGTAQWAGAYFNGSTMLRAGSLLRHRVDESFPAFYRDDQDPVAPGRQPDMGNGDPADGDLFGTYGGYYDWDSSTIVDSPRVWACAFWLTGTSSNPRDNFPGTFARVSVAVRRPQSFAPGPGEVLAWTLTRVADQQVFQAGRTTVGPDGIVRVEDLLVSKEPDRFRLTIVAPVSLDPGRVDGAPGSATGAVRTAGG